LIAVHPQAVGGERTEPDGARPHNAHPADPDRSNQLVTFGDRLFRAGNTKKAEERFSQAVRANPYAAAPRLRLAQIAFVRGEYAEASNRLREAETAQPGWLATTTLDIQSIYGEPGDFNRHIAQLESHLHAHPEDRDAWLVLGGQWFLSGRTARAADIFLRLDDPLRRPDVALSAFIDASRALAPEVADSTVSEPGGR
jgi:predicted Zn-dependent protease